MTPPPRRFTLREVESALARDDARWMRQGPVRWRAAVAMVLRERDGDVEVLVIRRAVRAGDRWSGDAALPGGRVDESDVSVEHTARRETLEEVGLDLGAVGARHLGRLSDHPPHAQRRWANFTVAPIVFAVEGDVALTLSRDEVADAMWVPLSHLARGSERMLWWFRPWRRVPLAMPMLLRRWRWRETTIWGLTHGILQELLNRLG